VKRAIFPALILIFLSIGIYYLFLQPPVDQPKAPVRPAGPSAEELAKHAEDLRKKAEGGDVTAAYDLGALYDQGIGVKRDADESIRWFRKAGEKGHPDAEYNLGMFYADGTVREPNYQEAAKWLRMAADRDVRAAQLQLALLYEHGDGVAKDPVEAAFWFSLAARGTFAVSPIVRDEIMGALSNSQKESVLRRVASWKPLPKAGAAK
jgi:hypothetical protein